MRNHKRKKHPIKKPANMLAPIHWGWMLAVFAASIGCLIFLPFARSQIQASPNDSTILPPVTSTSSPIPNGSDTPGAQQTTGIFPLSVGGPIPVPANVLHPTNIARVIVKSVLTSIYAGSLTRTPSLGALAILQENLTTGQQSLHLYQTSQPVGALTILTVHNDILTLATQKGNGSFNLATDRFHFS